ncbi:Aldo/keto reductase [Flagelloscypha sp. PMI_526]|nr:Aldo/keto reductase [Flagelloscypha sp. PMI_526]
MSNIQVKARYQRLGSSGLRVSVPIFGTMGLGSKLWQPWVIEGEEALGLLKAAWDRGINTFDTANSYSNGVSEQLLGQFIKKYNIPRNKILILTKCLHLTLPEDVSAIALMRPQLNNERDNINQAGLSRAAIFNQVDASLKRLDTDYIDLLQIHRFDPNTPVEETMKALHDLVTMGKVRYIGASSMRTWQFALMNEAAEKHGWTKFTSMQDEYSLLYREEEREMIPYCKFNGIGIIPWAPLCFGSLGRPLTTESATVREKIMKGTPLERKVTEASAIIINRVEELAKKKNWSMAQVAIAWVGTKIDSPIVGLSSVERIEESILDPAKFVLTDGEVKYLEDAYQPLPVRGHP